jgi:hypothetical protein
LKSLRFKKGWRFTTGMRLYWSEIGHVGLSLAVGAAVGSASIELSKSLGYWPSDLISTGLDCISAFGTYTLIGWARNRKKYKGQKEKTTLLYALKENKDMGAIIGLADILYVSTRIVPMSYMEREMKPFIASLIFDAGFYLAETVIEAWYCSNKKRKAMEAAAAETLNTSFAPLYPASLEARLPEPLSSNLESRLPDPM